MLVTLRHRRAQALSVALSLAILATLLVAPGGAANAANPPPNPTNGQLSAAAQRKAALADQVGQLSARVIEMQTELRQLDAAKEMAEQKLAYAISKLEQAKLDSQAATQAVGAAQSRVEAAQSQFRSYVQATYMSGDIGGTTGTLLTASDPNIVLQQSALQNYESSHQLDAIGNLKSATVAKSNADARARLAVQRQKSFAAAADKANKDAEAAVVAAQARKQQLDQTLAATQSSLQAAQEQLATLNHQRAAYLAYQREQARLRALALARKRAAEARARAAAARARALAAARERALERQRQRDAERRRHQGDDSSTTPISSPPASSGGGGGYTSSRDAGRNAVARAEQYLGWMYAWAGGNADGPTYGVCAGDGAYNDCHIKGFDCSGLVLYGWAPYLSMPHYAAAQYSSVGSYHPSLGNLRPGDLLFWSSNGRQSGIHHVAMYVGGGNVIQAPQSGSVIQITAVGDVDWGYFGATRPLS